MSNYFLSQVFVLIATVFIGCSYRAKSKKNVMLLCVIYCVFYSTHYLLLGAYTGMLMSLISASRNILFYFNAKKGKKNRLSVLLFFAGIALVAGFYSYEDVFSILSMSANILSTYSIWQDDVYKYRLLAVPVSICFILYAIRIQSVFSIIVEFVLLIVEIVSIISIRYEKKEGLDCYEEV